jgi:hypothetical protein
VISSGPLCWACPSSSCLCPLPLPVQKIRTVELDGKVIKLQIVSADLGEGWGGKARGSLVRLHAPGLCVAMLACMLPAAENSVCWTRTRQRDVVHTLRLNVCAACLLLLLRCAVGHSWPGALPHHHQQLLPWRTRHHREQLSWGCALRCAGVVRFDVLGLPPQFSCNTQASACVNLIPGTQRSPSAACVLGHCSAAAPCAPAAQNRCLRADRLLGFAAWATACACVSCVLPRAGGVRCDRPRQLQQREAVAERD